MPNLDELNEYNAEDIEITVTVTESTFRERAFFAEAYGLTLRLDEPFGTRIGASYNADLSRYSEQYFMGHGQVNVSTWGHPGLTLLKARMRAAIHGYIQALAYVERATTPTHK